MSLNGASLIAGQAVQANTGSFQAVDPASGIHLQPAFDQADQSLVDRACIAADSAFHDYRRVPAEQRAAFLNAIADEMEQRRDLLVTRAHQETGLPDARLQGELGRTTGQLRFLAQQFIEQRLDEQASDGAPAFHLRQLPIGPVAVFGASNFPLAFSVAGGDTAAALIAGCPVVVKGHPAHPGTSEIAADAVNAAISSCSMPSGVFSLVQSSSNEVAAALVQHSKIKALAFTGSLNVGRLLFDMAASRPEPIPVFAEMGSTNPIFLLDGAVSENPEKVAEGFAQSLMLGVGQFCTNPGLLFVRKSEALDSFLDTCAQQVAQFSPQPMLTPGIKHHYERASHKMQSVTGVSLVAQSQPSAEGESNGVARLFQTDASSWFANPQLQEEVFGPSSLIVICDSQEQMIEATGYLHGHLTATIHASQSDRDFAQALIPRLEIKVGRLIFNDFPTGVAVCKSMVHGGPYPATTNAATTSVGALAIQRFLRPICYQNVPNGFIQDIG